MRLFERLLSRSRLRDARQRLAREATPQSYAALAEEHARAGDMDSVLQVCEEGLEMFPEDRGLERLATRARQLALEGRMRELAREIREAPRAALYREMCEILLETGRFRRAEEVAAEWYERCEDASALLTRAYACSERFFVDRSRDEGRRAWDMLGRFERESPPDEHSLHLRARLASAVGCWGAAIRAVTQLLEMHPGNRVLEARFRTLSTLPDRVESFEQGLREVEKTGRFADEGQDGEASVDVGHATAIRPLLKDLGRADGVEAALFTRGSTALVQGLKGATAERTARAVRDVVQASRTTARRLGIGQGLEVQLEGDFGVLLIASSGDGSAALWQRDPVTEVHQRELAALISRSGSVGEGEERG